MAKMRGSTLGGATVSLDDNDYEDVTFNRCTLVYAATARVTFTDCRFSKCKVDLRGIAKEKVGHMTATYESEPSLIEGIFDSIKDGAASG